MATRVRSFSKINLGLAVGPLRADGFHSLATMYLTLEAHDMLTVRARVAPATRITLTVDHPGVPSTARGDAERNTVFRMVELALRELGLAAEVEIDLQKRLPVQGGLGAGSANAAAALMGLERALGKALPAGRRLEMAEEVGSDVPLFLLGGSVLGLDRGQSVVPLPDLLSLPVVLAIPKVGVSTGMAFRALDARAGLTEAQLQARVDTLSRVLASAWAFPGDQELSGSPGSEPSGCGLLEADGSCDIAAGPPSASESLPGFSRRLLNTTATGDLDPPNASSDSATNPENQRGSKVVSERADKEVEAASMRSLRMLLAAGLENDFEDVAFEQHPSLRLLKEALAGSAKAAAEPALHAALSGSGSALFGMYATTEAARAAQARVQALGAKTVLTRTLGRAEYWQGILA